MDCNWKQAEPDGPINVKIILDMVKGLERQHINMVLHRDVQLDNVVVFSMGKIITINGKPTDFGSIRDINLPMTNVTFTEGVVMFVNVGGPSQGSKPVSDSDSREQLILLRFPFPRTLLRFGSFLPSELTNQAVSLSYGLRPLAKTTPIVMKQS